jgi:hypothetical protein
MTDDSPVVDPALIAEYFGVDEGRDETVDARTESINTADVSPVVDPELMAEYFGEDDDETTVPARVVTAAVFPSSPGNTQPDSSKIDNNASTKTKDSVTKPNN